jgi:hypothetical protein
MQGGEPHLQLIDNLKLYIHAEIYYINNSLMSFFNIRKMRICLTSAISSHENMKDRIHTLSP